MSTTRDAVAGDVWRLLGDQRLQSPPTGRDARGRICRADGGEWDAWYELPEWDRTYIGTHYMAGNGQRPDVAADVAGLDLTDFWAQLVATVRAERAGRRDGRHRDLLDEWGEEPDPVDGLEYALELAGPHLLDLVGPADIAQRAGVTVSAVRKWRERYADFPGPLAVIGAGRRAPRGEAAGSPVWAWAPVARWLDATGRQSPR